jgi:copper chaperone
MEANMKNATLEVNGMTCGHCTMSVEKALKGSNGVSTAKVDLESKKAEVVFDENTVSTSQLIQAVKEAGYEAREL